MNLTDHASKRARQRGFSEWAINIMVEYGRREPAPGKADRVIFGKKEKHQAIGALKQAIQRLDNTKGTVIISEDGEVLTAYKNP